VLFAAQSRRLFRGRDLWKHYRRGKGRWRGPESERPLRQGLIPGDDNYGSYRLIAAEQGKCELRLEYKGQSPAIEVFSYAESARYDLIVESPKGSYLLKRK
jgi:hypothetical protein